MSYCVSFIHIYFDMFLIIERFLHCGEKGKVEEEREKRKGRERKE